MARLRRIPMAPSLSTLSTCRFAPARFVCSWGLPAAENNHDAHGESTSGTPTGTVSVDGRDVMSVPLRELRLGIGYVIQQIGLFHT